jgi:hypothetical protein
MPYTLAFQGSQVPAIPDHPGRQARPADRQEHFGTEALALRRAADLLPGPVWLDLRLYGPDGSRLATQEQLLARLRIDPISDPISDPGHDPDHHQEPSA